MHEIAVAFLNDALVGKEDRNLYVARLTIVPLAGGDAPAYGLGAMTDKSWRDFSQIMTSQGLYPQGLDVTKAYDLRFQRHTLQNFQ